MRDNALLHQNAPLTVKDALQVCRRPWIPYLWVDSLCIIQDDPKFRDAEISRMGEIYSGSELTIVAVDGTSAHSGLSGVTVRSRKPQLSGHLDGLGALEILPGYQTSVMGSPWFKRRWTYQELCLSKRLLLFAEQQVFLRCASQISYEDPSIGSYGLREWNRWNAPTDIAFGIKEYRQYDTFAHFAEAIQQYSSRKLTLQSDVFNAFSGVIQNLYTSSGGKAVFELPEADMDKALLWQPADVYSSREVIPDVVVSSWTWASHSGQVWVRDGTDFAGSDVQYYACRDQDLGLHKVQSASYDRLSSWGKGPVGPLTRNPDFPKDIPRHTYIMFGRYDGCSPLSTLEATTDSTDPTTRKQTMPETSLIFCVLLLYALACQDGCFPTRH